MKKNNENQIKRIEKLTQTTLLRTIAVAVFCVILVIIQIATQYNSEKRILSPGFFFAFMNFLIIAATVYIAGAYFLLSRKLIHFGGTIKAPPIPIIGISMLVTSVCFFWQSLIDMITFFEKSVTLLEKAGADGDKTSILTVFGDKNGIIAIGAAFCLLSGVAFLLDGLAKWLGSKECPFWLRLAPPIWGGISLLYIMISYPSIVSAQSDVSKAFCAVITILFLLYNAAELCGLCEQKSREFSTFIRISFSVLIFLNAFPYGFSLLFLTKAETVNMPHTAYVGLFIFGAMNSLQLLIQALHQIKSKTRIAGVRESIRRVPTPQATEPPTKKPLETPIAQPIEQPNENPVEETPIEQTANKTTDNPIEWSYFDE